MRHHALALDQAGTTSHQDNALSAANHTPDALDLNLDIVAAVLSAFDSTGLAICVCDDRDIIRFTNRVFREQLMPHLGEDPVEFAYAVYETVSAGEGLKLDTMPLDAFVARIRDRRRTMTGSMSFATNTVDGSWLLVTDTKLPNGWLVAICQDITALKREELKLRADHASVVEESQTDFLTGVPNRRHGFKQATALLERSQMTGQSMTVALLDLDHFKGVNDRYGHEAGDLVLTHFANHVWNSVGPAHAFCRTGGEEFLLVSAEPDPERLRRMVCRILAALPPISLTTDNASLRITASAGVASSRPTDQWADLLRRADTALYQAKARGRNRVELASDPT